MNFWTESTIFVYVYQTQTQNDQYFWADNVTQGRYKR